MEPSLRASARPWPNVQFTSEGVARRLDDERRARMLTRLCLTGVAAHLVVILVQALAHRMAMIPLATRLAMDAVLLVAPLARRWTGSVHIGALLASSAVAVGLPAIALEGDGVNSPMIVTLPLIPLLMAPLLGRRGSLLVGAALLAGLGVVAVFGGAGPLEAPGLHADRLIRGLILGGCVAIAALTAFLHERERGTMEGALRALATRLQDESTHDVLTRLFNRRYLDDRLAAEMSFARRHGTDLSVVLIDVDHFKAVNDLHGHGAGDDVLTEVASRLQHCLRAEDVAARLGGEEFVAILRTTNLAAARIVAERIRGVIEATAVRLQPISIPITISAGCASLGQTRAANPKELLAAADAQLYAAKRAGRNRVMSADPAAAQGPTTSSYPAKSTPPRLSRSTIHR